MLFLPQCMGFTAIDMLFSYDVTLDERIVFITYQILVSQELHSYSIGGSGNPVAIAYTSIQNDTNQLQ